ncbi:MAG: TerC family protein [Alphaproteobacteria bacterium]
MEWLWDPTAWLGLLTLILLELILGIDNLVFIAILAQKLPAHQRDKARKIGLILALGMRLVLLASIAWLTTLTAPLFAVLGQEFSGRDLIMLGGGLFLLWKATTEVHGRLEGHGHGHGGTQYKAKFWMVIAQIIVLDAVFSIDSVITAVGMSDHLSIMMLAVAISIVLMIWVSKPLTEFVNAHPTIVMLCLGFLLMVGFSLVAEGFGSHIPKGYLYAAIGFSVLIEAVNQFAQVKLKRRVREETPDMRERTANALLRMLGARKGGDEQSSQEIGVIIQQAAQENFLSDPEKDLLRGVLNLTERSVSTIMTPRTDIEWIDITESDEGIRRQLTENTRSQLLVGEGSLEAVLGVVHREDFLTPLIQRGWIPPLAKIMKEPLFVHENASILMLLETFRKKRADLAVVIDEFGTVQGLITHHDLLEGIAGEFPDHDDPAPETMIAKQDDGSWVIDGAASIYDVRDRTGFDYELDGSFSTMAGFVLHEAGKFPNVGEVLKWEGWKFEVLEMDGKRIARVRLAQSGG